MGRITKSCIALEEVGKPNVSLTTTGRGEGRFGAHTAVKGEGPSNLWNEEQGSRQKMGKGVY